MNTENLTPALVAAATEYALALVAYQETSKYCDVLSKLNEARDNLYLAHEKLNEVAKEHVL